MSFHPNTTGERCTCGTVRHDGDAIITREIYSHGSITGRLEAINFHGKKPAFWICPSVGPTRVFCKFSALEKDKAKEALEKIVRVHGKKAFRAGARFPHRVDVRIFEILDLPSDLGSFLDLQGAGAAEDESVDSVEYIRKLRNEW